MISFCKQETPSSLPHVFNTPPAIQKPVSKKFKQLKIPSRKFKAKFIKIAKHFIRILCLTHLAGTCII